MHELKIDDVVVTQEQKFPENMKFDLCWSHDGENFHGDFDTALWSLDDPKVGDVIFRGKSKLVVADDILDIDSILEDLWERADDIVGESAEYYPTVSNDAFDELYNFMIDWISRHCQPNFYTISNVEEYTITEDDLN